MRFARWTFYVAGSYGLRALVPQYFLLDKIARDTPPAVTHVEFFYGFVGVAIAWQLAFFAIGSDPRRYRPIMLAAIVEKLTFAVPAIVLFVQGRLASSMLAAGVVDGILAAAFGVAWLKTKRG